MQPSLERKSTDITANNKSLPGFSKWEHLNGAPVTGRSALQNGVANSYPAPGILSDRNSYPAINTSN
jgi:hypothetical protein